MAAGVKLAAAWPRGAATGRNGTRPGSEERTDLEAGKHNRWCDKF